MGNRSIEGATRQRMLAALETAAYMHLRRFAGLCFIVMRANLTLGGAWRPGAVCWAGQEAVPRRVKRPLRTPCTSTALRFAQRKRDSMKCCRIATRVLAA